MNLPANEIIQFPTGKWGFVGRVSLSLLFCRKDGVVLTAADEEEIVRLHGHGERFVTGKGTAYKRLVLDTKADAEACLEAMRALDSVWRKAAERRVAQGR